MAPRAYPAIATVEDGYSGPIRVQASVVAARALHDATAHGFQGLIVAGSESLSTSRL